MLFLTILKSTHFIIFKIFDFTYKILILIKLTKYMFRNTINYVFQFYHKSETRPLKQLSFKYSSEKVINSNYNRGKTNINCFRTNAIISEFYCRVSMIVTSLHIIYIYVNIIGFNYSVKMSFSST